MGSKDEIGILTANFNIMARQLQSTIREAENERNKLDTLFLHMTDGVVAFNKSGKVIQENPAAEDMLARPIGEDYLTACFLRTRRRWSRYSRWNSPATWDRSGLGRAEPGAADGALRPGERRGAASWW